MVATAVESVSPFEHTDAAFAADAPPLPATEPALVFIRASRGRLRAAPRQDHAPDASVRGGPFVGGRAEAAIGSRDIRCAAKDHLMPIEAAVHKVTSAGRFGCTS